MNEQKNLSTQYDIALRSTYDELYEMNITKDSYQIIYHVKDKYVIPPEKGCLHETIPIIARDIVHSEDTERFIKFFDLDNLHKELSIHECVIDEFRKLRQTGEYKWASLLVVPMESEKEEILLVYIMDIDEKKHAQALEQENMLLLQRERDSQRYQIIVERTNTIVMEWNTNPEWFYFSQNIFKFTFSEHIKGPFNKVYLSYKDIHEEDWPIVQKAINMLRNGTNDVNATARLRLKDGTFLWCKCTAAVVRRMDGKLSRLIVTVSDTDALVKAQQTLAYRAEYDSLTGYGNFDKYKRDVKELLQHRGDKKYSLWYCDLKNFKYINDIYGYDTGDKVLRYWADILAADLRPGEAFARVSADNFTSFRFYEKHEELENRFLCALTKLREFDALKNKKFLVEIVSGIYCIEHDEDVLSVADMIDRANIAQKSVKQQPGSKIAYYSEEMRSRVIRDKAMESDMDKALSTKEFCIYFQGQVDIQNGNKICGAEALARWNRPNVGLVPPGEFIPLFEKNGFIVELDGFVFEEVCKYLAKRIKEKKQLIKIAINVSRLTLLQPDFLERYTSIKHEYNIPNGILELECTETVMIENLAAIGKVTEELRQRGFLLGMDDFGSGYSSLNVLKDLVVDVLKLDMAFFQNGLTKSRDRAIVSSIISMANALNMRVIAEGVETSEQVTFLRKIGCDVVQGYVFSRPQPMEEFCVHSTFEIENQISYEDIFESKNISSQYQKMILDTITDGFCIFELNQALNLLYVSSGYYKMFEYTKTLLSGIYPEDLRKLLSLIRKSVNKNEAFKFNCRIRKQNGTLGYLQLHIFELAEKRKMYPIFLALLWDVTENQEIKNQLSDALEQQMILFDNLPGGVIIFELSETFRVQYVSEGVYRMNGFIKNEYDDSNNEKLTKKLLPEDRRILEDNIKEALENDRPIELVYRSKRKNGYGWTMARGRFLGREPGKYPLIYVVLLDVTAQKEAELELKIQAERYNLLEETLQETLFDYDVTKDIMCMTYRKNGIVEHQQIEYFRKNWNKGTSIPPIYATVYAKRFTQACQKVMQTTLDVPIRADKGEYRWHRVILSSIADRSNKVTRVVGRMFDVHYEIQQRLEAEERAKRDQMTGLLNKVSGEMIVRKILQSSEKNDRFIMIMVDLDNFKQINDSYGHAFGDDVLQKVSHLMQELFPEDSVLIRFGGDEILAFMQASNEDPQLLIEKFQTRLSNWDNGKCVIHCSIGLVNSTEKDFNPFFSAADFAMYQAKQDGKNCYVYHEESKYAADINK